MFNLSKFKSLGPKIQVPEVTDLSPGQNSTQAKLTRRAALRKIGMAGGMTILGTLTIDELARISVGKLQQNQVTQEIGDSLAREFKDAGVAFADEEDDLEYYDTGQVRRPNIVDIMKAYEKCQGTPGYGVWTCMAGELGSKTFAKNFDYIWCAIKDPNGNNGSCKGFPAKTCCDPTVRMETEASCQACAEAKMALCVVQKGAPATAACQQTMQDEFLWCLTVNPGE